MPSGLQSDGSYLCKPCHLTFKSHEHLRQHKAEARAAGVPSHIHCKHCGQDFKTGVAEIQHIHSYHPQGQNLICRKCNQGPFTRAAAFIEHIEKGKCTGFSTAGIEYQREKKASLARGLQELGMPARNDFSRYMGSSITSHAGDKERWAGSLMSSSDGGVAFYSPPVAEPGWLTSEVAFVREGVAASSRGGSVTPSVSKAPAMTNSREDLIKSAMQYGSKGVTDWKMNSSSSQSRNGGSELDDSASQASETSTQYKFVCRLAQDEISSQASGPVTQQDPAKTPPGRSNCTTPRAMKASKPWNVEPSSSQADESRSQQSFTSGQQQGINTSSRTSEALKSMNRGPPSISELWAQNSLSGQKQGSNTASRTSEALKFLNRSSASSQAGDSWAQDSASGQQHDGNTTAITTEALKVLNLGSSSSSQAADSWMQNPTPIQQQGSKTTWRTSEALKFLNRGSINSQIGQLWASSANSVCSQQQSGMITSRASEALKFLNRGSTSSQISELWTQQNLASSLLRDNDIASQKSESLKLPEPGFSSSQASKTWTQQKFGAALQRDDTTASQASEASTLRMRDEGPGNEYSSADTRADLVAKKEKESAQRGFVLSSGLGGITDWHTPGGGSKTVNRDALSWLAGGTRQGLATETAPLEKPVDEQPLISLAAVEVSEPVMPMQSKPQRTISASDLSGLSDAKVLESMDIDHPDHPSFNSRRYYSQYGDNFVCPKQGCGKTFLKAGPLVSHLRSMAHAVKRYHCPYCHRRFPTLTSIVAHAEQSSSRCHIRDSDNYDAWIDQLTGGVLDVGVERHVDGTVKYEMGEVEW
ncbi:Zinc finger, C2H2 [Ophiocordyceps camponoti-floridani]|uniref:Zinc finger, C2H2 n=1 Tax=Ophiocordyceps camponoti-floridani TaxID=2030778 RepID=A0A8H4VEB4_9HYPO|nr:Zinc finger, C2H2 [Ophiocordyceps camponoti-floridani]